LLLNGKAFGGRDDGMETQSAPPKPHMLFLDDNAADAQLEQVRQTRSGSIAIVVRGWKCQTKETLHNEIGAALQFPGYYGENWNALDECLHDLSWLPAGRYLLVINCVEKLLPDDDQSLRLFLDVLSEASCVWSERGILFEVIFCGNRAGLDRALTLFRSVAAEPIKPLQRSGADGRSPLNG
jgi:hypothetical protein